MTDHLTTTEKIATLQDIGCSLRLLRQERLLSIEEVAEKTRIQPRLLRALEEGQMDILPEPVYIQGIIKKYGESLGVNALELAKSIPASQMQIVPLQSNRWDGFNRPQIRPIHLYISYILMLTAAVSALSHTLNNSVQSIETAQKPAATNTKLAAAQDTELLSSKPSQPLELEISAKTTSWVKVVVDGKPAFEGSLRAGNAKTWTAQRELILTTGNAGGIIVTKNNTQLGELGAPGEKREVKFQSKS